MIKHISKFWEFINESIKLSDMFNEEENETLGFLIHDKEHILGTTHKSDPTLDSIFNKVKYSYYNSPLWRGVYRREKDLYEELYLSRDIGVTTRYLSFSESKETGILFSTQRNMLIELEQSKGLLNYHRWIREIVEQELQMGGDTYYYRDILETADEELEHIMNIGTKIQVTGKRQEGDLTIYTIKQL